MHTFIISELPLENECWLSEEESKHLSKVLRIRPGEKVHITDGKGGGFMGVVMPGQGPNIKLQVTERRTNPPPLYHVEIAVALPRPPDRQEFLIEKLTELSVDAIHLITTSRSEKFNPRMDRLEKTAISALKQSHQQRIPQINQPVSLESFLQNHSFTGPKFMAWCEEKSQKLEPSGSGGLILIGPEGDFTESENQQAQKAGFIPVQLTPQILRTETAAFWAAAILSIQRNINQNSNSILP